MNNFCKDIILEGRRIGPDDPIFIVAEIGINHNGELLLAKRLVEIAKACGADAVKFQTFKTEEFMADRKLTYEYEVNGQLVKENMFDMFKRLEMPESWHCELFDHARSIGIIPLTSVADPESVALVSNIGISALKLSSEDFINLPLMECAVKSGLPLLLSTGMANEEEIDDVLALLKRHGRCEVAFLHCVSLYPTPDGQAHLARMAALTEKTGAVTGYSDHTIGNEAVCAAAGMGAAIVEKHFTLDKSMAGPDHAFSADPEEFSAMVRAVRKIEYMIGKNNLDSSPGESAARLTFRRSIVAATNLEKGTILKDCHMALKRPGNGLRAREMPRINGRTLARSLDADNPILFEDLKPKDSDKEFC